MYTKDFDVSSRDNTNNYSLLKKRIDENNRDILGALFLAEPLDEINAIYIKVKIERATADSAKIFNEYMKDETERNNKNYIIDFSDALFMDSTFLGSLVLILKKVHAKGKSMNFVLNYDKLKILSAIDPLKKILNMFPTFEQAIENVKKDN